MSVGHHDNHRDNLDDYYDGAGLGDHDYLADHHDHLDGVNYYFDHRELHYVNDGAVHVDNRAIVRVRTAGLLALHRPG